MLDDDGPKSRQSANNKLLVCQMATRNETEGFLRPEWTFWEVLENLLSIINLNNGSLQEPTKALVYNSSMILARLMEELVSHASGTYVSSK